MLQDFLSVVRTKSLFSSGIPLNFGSCFSSCYPSLYEGSLFSSMFFYSIMVGCFFYPCYLSVGMAFTLFHPFFIWRGLLQQYNISAGGESFFIVDSSQEEQSSLSSYVDLVDSFREIHRRTWPNSPALVSILCFVYIFGGLECVGAAPLLMSPILYF
jgi:hypothetical protein